MRRLGMFIVCFLVLCGQSFADTLYLKNGRVIQGQILERSERQVKIDMNGITLTYYMDEIDRIEAESNTVLSPAPSSGTGPQAAKPSRPLGSASLNLPTSRNELVFKYMEVTGVKSNMQKTFEDILDAAPAEKKAELRQVLDLEEVLRHLVPVYQQYFSDQDLRELIAFYESDVGRKLLLTAPLILKDSMDKSLEYFQNKLE